jgi:hypothetical protein
MGLLPDQQVWQMRFKDFVTGEMIEGFKQWFKIACYCLGLIWLLDILPKLPDEFARPIADKLVGMVK